MRNLTKITLIFALVVVFFACKKDNKSTPQNKLPELVNTTWAGYSYTDKLSGTKYYDYLHFTSSTKVNLYTYDILGKEDHEGDPGVTTCTYQVTGNEFVIYFPNGTSAAGKATDNTSVITYQGVSFVKR
ncbi:hypothetical protein J3L18_10825 [Mucilaginibacter gossypii]|uniref:hypothetical protein n=1 Tax=Mucilaginibacter gossypii TaxID=551996 RepID=UPI000DCC402E|nr:MULTISPECIES: hypothetical protein [Mucilaginibacter]QTE39520.1 hypothetical protein J3L18_10825 [Mucilaginibacter gossypii]RAV56118.1 hypothetical protein DIU36_15295 [Mucilaginibacter rubeus]